MEKHVWSDYIYIQLKKLRESLIYWLGMCVCVYIYNNKTRRKIVYIYNKLYIYIIKLEEKLLLH